MTEIEGLVRRCSVVTGSSAGSSCLANEIVVAVFRPCCHHIPCRSLQTESREVQSLVRLVGSIVMNGVPNGDLLEHEPRSECVLGSVSRLGICWSAHFSTTQTWNNPSPLAPGGNVELAPKKCEGHLDIDHFSIAIMRARPDSKPVARGKGRDWNHRTLPRRCEAACLIWVGIRLTVT